MKTALESFSQPACVIVGGGLGSYLRYLVQGWMHSKTGPGFPYGTLLVNLSGAFFIGFLMTAFLELFNINPQWRLFLVVGVLGGFTTFSSAAWETYQLFTLGSPLQGILYMTGSLAGGAIGVILGIGLGRLI